MRNIDNWTEQRVKIIKNDCDIIYLKVQRFHVSPSNTLWQLETGAKKALPQQKKQTIGFLLGVGFGKLCFAAKRDVSHLILSPDANVRTT